MFFKSYASVYLSEFVNVVYGDRELKLVWSDYYQVFSDAADRVRLLSKMLVNHNSHVL